MFCYIYYKCRLSSVGSQWIYFYYNDVLKMANTPTEEPIEICVDKTWFDEEGNEIAEEDLDSDFVATVQLLRKKDNGNYVPVKVEYSEGQPTITEDSCTPADYVFTYTDNLGKDADHAVSEGGKTVEVTNKDELTEANVTKIWKDSGNSNTAWNSEVESITLKLTRMKGEAQDDTFGTSGTVTVVVTGSGVTSITPEISGVTGTVTLKTADTPSDGYVVTLKGLQKYYDDSGTRREYTYRFEEVPVEGYHEPVYKTASDENLNGGVVSGGSIINTPEGGVSLPETGGIGTRVFYLLGACMVLAAALILCRKKCIE